MCIFAAAIEFITLSSYMAKAFKISYLANGGVIFALLIRARNLACVGVLTF